MKYENLLQFLIGIIIRALFISPNIHNFNVKITFILEKLTHAIRNAGKYFL